MTSAGSPRVVLLDEANSTTVQRAALARAGRGRRSVPVPFRVLAHVPALCERVGDLGAQIRFEGALPDRLREAAILVSGRNLGCRYEVEQHRPLARVAGVSPVLLDDDHDTDRRLDAPEDERIVAEVCEELLTSHRLSETTFARARALLGEEGLIELTALVGYYAMLGFVINVFADP